LDKKQQQGITLLGLVKAFLVLLVFIFSCLGFLIVDNRRNDYEQQRLADLLQIPTYDEIAETIRTWYPLESSTHDSFDSLFSSLSDSVRYFCEGNGTWKTGPGCPKNQCSNSYLCEIGELYVLRISFTEDGQVMSYFYGKRFEPYFITR
jgi:hypothetical protein